MSVVLLGMYMPKSCRGCYLMKIGVGGWRGEFWCSATRFIPITNIDARPDWCPLCPLPEKHGRLIDANALKETLDYYIREAGWSEEINKALCWVKDEFIDSEPTIVEAEGEPCSGEKS